MNEQSIFIAALEHETPARGGYLDDACAGDVALRQRVEKLLVSHEQAVNFLDQPVGKLAPTCNPTPVERPGTQIGPYKLREQIGEGGFGIVFVAEQEKPVRRKVALKIIKPGMDTKDVIARFEAERQALALMDHPNVARVLDAGATDSGRPFFVMNLVQGVPIVEFCDKNSLPTRDRLLLFADVCRAVQHAHQKGIIHRDLKPPNIMVTLHDGKPVAKVIDFGVSKALSQQLTEKSIYTAYGQMIGTPSYMSPEQAEMTGLGIDTRSDIYSLGVLLYELLTGKTPLDANRLRASGYAEILRIIREEEPPRPSLKISTLGAEATVIAQHRHTDPQQLRRALRGELDWIVMKCLEKDRSRRYEPAVGLARDIERYLKDEPVEACPPSAGYRVRKFARKHRAALTTALAFAGFLVLGAAFSAWLAVRATVAEHQARSAQGQAETDRDRAQSSERLASERLEQVTQEKERAEKAERQAAVEAAVAKAVNDFLQQDLLGQADLANQPGGAIEEEAPPRDANINVRTLLDRAAQRIVGRFPDQPLVEAATRQAIGVTYFGLTEYALAQPHLEAALDIRRQHLGVQHPDTLTSQNNLGRLYMRQDQYAKAEPLYLLTLEVRQKKLGADHPDTLTSQDNLARLYTQQLQYAKAEPLLLQTWEVQKKKLGEDNPDTLATQQHLAHLYLRQGRYAEAERLYLRTLEVRKKKLGEDHPFTLASQEGLAKLYSSQGKYAKGEALYLQTLEVRKKRQGEDNPDTLWSQHVLARLYSSQGKYAKAEPLLLQTWEVQKKKLGEDNPATLASQQSLAHLYLRLGRYAEAERLYLRTLEVRKKKLGEDHPITLTSQHALADLYQSQGQYAEADPLLLDVLERQRRRLGAGHPDVAATLASLGLALLLERKFAEAELRLRDCLTIYQPQQPDAWQTFDAKSLLGASLLGQQKYAEAEPLLVSGYQGLKQRADTIPAENKFPQTKALERLVDLYTAWDKPDEGAKWRLELDAVNPASQAKD